MVRLCCLAGVDAKDVLVLRAALKSAGELDLPVIADLTIGALAKVAADVLIVDLDRLEVDPLETLRQLRFVLPECVIVVYTAMLNVSWSRACHLAGASCLLAKESRESQLSFGLRRAFETGCFTDPRFAA